MGKPEQLAKGYPASRWKNRDSHLSSPALEPSLLNHSRVLPHKQKAWNQPGSGLPLSQSVYLATSRASFQTQTWHKILPATFPWNSLDWIPSLWSACHSCDWPDLSQEPRESCSGGGRAVRSTELELPGTSYAAWARNPTLGEWDRMDAHPGISTSSCRCQRCGLKSIPAVRHAVEGEGSWILL